MAYTMIAEYALKEIRFTKTLNLIIENRDGSCSASERNTVQAISLGKQKLTESRMSKRAIVIIGAVHISLFRAKPFHE